MVREGQDTQRPGTPRPRPGSNTSRNSNGASESGAGSKGVLSKVIGSLRHRHHDEKRKTDGSNKQKQQSVECQMEGRQKQQDDSWVANYEITHRPDRPKVDKRTTDGPNEQKQQDDSWIANYEITHHASRPKVDKKTTEKLRDRVYAIEIDRIQKRSKNHYVLDHTNTEGVSIDRSIVRPLPPPPAPPQQMVQANTPNFSPMSNRMGSPLSLPYSPPSAFDRPQWSPDSDRGAIRRHNRVPSDPLSPGAMTIQVYRGSIVDSQASHAGLPRPPADQDDQGPLLLPRKYDPTESYAKRAVMRDSGYARKGSSSSTDTQAVNNNTVHRKAPSANLHSTATTAASPIPLTSSPTSYISPATPPQRVVRSLDNNYITTAATRTFAPSHSSSGPYNIYSKKPAAAPAPKTKTCVMPGCSAPLLTDLDREQNVCAPCRKEFRQSTFDAANEPVPRAPAQSDLETLRALVGSPGLGNDDYNNNSNKSAGDTLQTTALERGARAKLVNKATSNFHGETFKLRPAPPGKRRRHRLSRLGSGGSGSGANATRKPVPMSAWSTSTASGISQGSGRSRQASGGSSSSSQHVAYQDRRLFQASRKLSDAQQSSSSRRAPSGEEEAQYDTYLTESPRSSRSRSRSRNSSGSWTSESPPRSEDGGSPAASLSPLSEPFDDADSRGSLRVAPLAPLAPTAYVPGETKGGSNGSSDRPVGGLRVAALRLQDSEPRTFQPLRVAPLAPVARSANSSSKSNSKSSTGQPIPPPPPPPLPPSPPPPRPSRPGRATVLYQAIDDIIDSYAHVDDEAETERRRADAVASYYQMDSEAVEMMRRGFF